MTGRTLNHLPEIYNLNFLNLVLRTGLVITMVVFGTSAIIDIFSNFSSQWYWLILAAYYTITVNETFTHRVCGHKMFPVNVNSLSYKIMTLISSADLGHGPVRAMALGHRAHHMYSDQGRADPINIREFWFGIACAMPFRGWFKNPEIPNPKKFLSDSYRGYHEIIDDPWTKFCEKHAILISFVYLSVLYVLFPTFLFNVVLAGRVIMIIGMFGAGVCHLNNIPLSYRHVNTPDSSHNNLVLHYMFLGIFGGLLQNNHHSHPNRLNMGRKWYEIDTSTPIAYVLKFLMEKK